MSSSNGRLCSILAGWWQATFYLDCHGLVSEGLSDETNDLDYASCSGSVMSDYGSTRKCEVMNSSRPTGFVGQEQSVWFGCIRDVSGILDDDAVGSTGQQSAVDVGVFVDHSHESFFTALVRKFFPQIRTKTGADPMTVLPRVPLVCWS